MQNLATAPGVISTVNKYYLGSKEVMEYLGCKQNKAYTVIRELRQELIDKKQLYPGLPQGKIPRKYFFERCMIED